jgi:hypothetical protein
VSGPSDQAAQSQSGTYGPAIDPLQAAESAAGRRWGAVGAVIATGVGATALSWFIAQHSLLGARWHLIVLVATVWLPLWAIGAWAATRIEPRRLALGLVLLFALTTRLAAATGTTPSISNDLYRYGWDAHVQLAGIDPYRYPPAAAQLRDLRTATQFPNPAGCAHIGDRPGCTTMNRADVRTIYPPVAEVWFDLVALLAPGNDARQWQIAGGLVDMATIGLLMVGLSRSGRDLRSAAWYALSPVAVIEFAGNGHVDGLGLLLLVAALLALQRGRRTLAGFLIGLAAMVKLYPGIAVVAAWRRGGWRMLVAAAATAVVSYAPHVLAVGTRVVGYLPGYLTEEHYGSGGRFLLVGILPLPSHVTTVLAVLIVLGVCGWVLSHDLEPAAGLALLIGAALLVATPVQPWYAAAAGGIGVLAAAPWWFLPAMAGEVYYAAIILDARHQVGIGRLGYGAALLLIAGCEVIRRRRRLAPGHGPLINPTG